MDYISPEQAIAEFVQKFGVVGKFTLDILNQADFVYPAYTAGEEPDEYISEARKVMGFLTENPLATVEQLAEKIVSIFRRDYLHGVECGGEDESKLLSELNAKSQQVAESILATKAAEQSN